jgi:hypothetical protein
MEDRLTSKINKDEEAVDKPDSSCPCVQDPFASLPSELRPRPQPNEGGLRQVTCPKCGQDYWTNRVTDNCIQCESSRDTK